MWAEFKEKTYENAFLAEMARLTNVLYSPDQNDENILGFDGAAFFPWHELPPFFPYVRRRRWRHLIGLSMSEFDWLAQRLDSVLPPFKFNVFLQYKRPEFLVRATAAEWSSWSRPYFRYGITPHQQALLQRVLAKAGHRAAVVYAAPAFHTARDLFRFGRDGQVMANSNVAGVGLIGDHGRFSFTSAGGYGIGHSKPTVIQSPPFGSLLESGMDSEGLPFTKHLKVLAGEIEEVIAEREDDRDLFELARETILGGPLAVEYPRTEKTFMGAIITIISFSEAFGVRVCAIG